MKDLKSIIKNQNVSKMVHKEKEEEHRKPNLTHSSISSETPLFPARNSAL